MGEIVRGGRRVGSGMERGLNIRVAGGGVVD